MFSWWVSALGVEDTFVRSDVSQRLWGPDARGEEPDVSLVGLCSWRGRHVCEKRPFSEIVGT